MRVPRKGMLAQTGTFEKLFRSALKDDCASFDRILHGLLVAGAQYWTRN